MKKNVFLLLFLLLQLGLFAQQSKSDSLSALLAIEKTDTGKVNLMNQLAYEIYNYDPENALILSQQALNLAKKIKYINGQAQSVGSLAIIFFQLGNYPKALEFNFQKLALDEKRNKPLGIASALITIGYVYSRQEEYDQALFYFYKSDSVINRYNLEEDKYFIYQAFGDVYDRLNRTDSAFNYFYKSLIIATNKNDENFMGASMTGLGHTYLKKKNYPFALLNYNAAISYLKTAKNENLLCEAFLGMAKLFQQLNKSDSLTYYANLSLSIANKSNFITRELDAAKFLSAHYQKLKKIDSAFVYMNKVQQLNDTVNSKGRIRESQLISSKEKLRQLEIEEEKKLSQQERKQILQYFFIGIFIPLFFMLTMLLSRIRVPIRVVKLLGNLSLLIFFEYITLLLAPNVGRLTNHTPIYEILIFVTFASIIIPFHHRMENWVIKKLTRHGDGSIRLRKVKLKVKGPTD